MSFSRYLSAWATMLVVASAVAQEDLADHLDLKPYFIGDTSAMSAPHATYDLLVGAVVDSVSYNGTWRRDKPMLYAQLMQDASSRNRSVLFNLKFVGDHVNIGMITDLARTIVDAYRSAPIDTAITKCFIHLVFPPSPIPPPEDDNPALKARVHINADGSLLLDGTAVNLVGLGRTLEERRVSGVYISTDAAATVGALSGVVGELAAHHIKAILDTKP